ncbi:MAG: hypothetical protein J6S67_17535 [Methanobrevibacter sp.]|nr:hypothetical protein [Methanobrevibacter sp.]
MKKLLITLITALAIGGCSTIKYLPTETNTEVHVKDSTVWNIKDSIRVIERSRYKDYGGLLDTLKVKGNRSHSTTWIDTTLNVLNTELVEEPIEEKSRIIFKDKLVYKDSIQVKKEYYPIEIEKEKKIYPRWMIVLSLLGVVSTLVLGFIGYLKIKRK